MKSGHVTTLLSSYIDGEVGEADRERIGSHLAECAECRAHLATLQDAVRLVRAVPPVGAPADLGARVLGAITKTPRPESLRLTSVRVGRWKLPVFWSPGGASPSITWRQAARLAATAVVAVLVGVFVVNLVVPTRSPHLYRQTVPGSAPVSSREPLRVAAPNLSGAGGAAQTDVAGVGAKASPPLPGQSLETFRSVIKTARLTLEVDSVDGAARRLLSIAEGNGGFIADSSMTQDEGSPQGQFTLRVPAARFASTIQDIEALGTVRQRQISAQDVTGEFVDLQARLRNLEHHERQLLLFMDRAQRVSDLLAIEQELSRVRGEIEQTTGRINYISHSVEMATVEVAVSQKASKVSVPLWDVQASLREMQAALIASVREILSVTERILVLGSALIPIAVIGFFVWLAVRRVKRVGVDV